MYEQHLHAYEKLSLSQVGLVMGILLLIIHAIALFRPAASRSWLTQAHDATILGQATLGIAFAWIMLLFLKQDWNPLAIELYEFEGVRKILLIACPIIWFVLSSMVKENLFPRALGLLLLLAVCVPLSAAYLQDPITRLLIPIWCYPVLTIAMFWVAKPYLFRDWMAWLCSKPALFTLASLAGLIYAAAITTCACLYW